MTVEREPKLLTPEKAAERLAISKRTFTSWCRDGKLPGVKVGRYWRIREADLDKFISDLSKD